MSHKLPFGHEAPQTRGSIEGVVNEAAEDNVKPQRALKITGTAAFVDKAVRRSFVHGSYWPFNPRILSSGNSLPAVTVYEDTKRLA
jgi:hypothetical protein